MLESKATPEIQAAAEKMGWIPPERYKGEPERFIDADAYVERGETILPIVKETNKRLQAELAELSCKHEETRAALTAAQDAIAGLEERHTVETQKAVAEARKQLKEQLAVASAEGKHADVAELTDQLVQLNAADKEAKAAPAAKAEPDPPAFVPPPELVEWTSQNTWFGKDKRKTALALAIGQELREVGTTAKGSAFYDLVSQELAKVYGPGEPTPDKAMSGRGGSGESPRSARSYASLPKEAKDACDADIKRFVGPGKRYKTADEWRTRYASIYYETEGV